MKNVTTWGILNLCNCYVSFAGGDDKIKKYFLNFFSSLSLNINKEIKSDIGVEFYLDKDLLLDSTEKYEISNKLIYYKENNKSIFGIKESWKIISFLNKIEVHFCSYNNFDVLNQVLRNIILYKIKSLNLISIHSSCVYIDNCSYVFLGYSGTGKSTFAIALGLKENAFLINDDRIIISPENRILSHFGAPVTFRIGTENLIPKLNEYAKQYKELLNEDKSTKYRTKIGIDYENFFGKKQKNNINTKIVFVFLKENNRNLISRLSYKYKIMILDELWQNQEIICNKENLYDLQENEFLLFEFKKADKEEFDNMINFFENYLKRRKNYGLH